MSDLYDKGLFEKFDQGKQSPMAKAPQYKFHLMVAAVVLVAALAFLWFRFQSGGSSMVNINKASVSELQRLPGVGPVLAKDIVKARPFSSLEQLKSVKGVGPKTYEKLANQITLE